MTELFADADGIFHQRIYGVDIAELDIICDQVRPAHMLQNMGLGAGPPADQLHNVASGTLDRWFPEI